jgi:seryl-tRNA synthetase
MADEVNTAAPEQTSKEEEKNSTSTAPGQGTQTSPQPEKSESTFTQADVNRIVKRELEAEKSKAKKLADEAAAKASGEFEKLANTYKADLDRTTEELNALQESYDTLSKQVDELVKTELKTLPDSVRDLAPKDASALLEWLPKARKTAEHFTPEAKEKAQGNTRGPKPSGQGGDAQKSAKETLLSRGRYSGF